MTEPAINSRLPLPGMAAISLWMLGLTLMGVGGVLNGHFGKGGPRAAVLVLCSLFAAAALGLLRLRRWGWALTLGAAFLCVCFGCYNLFRFHQTQWIVMVGVNLVFFLYLVRPEVTGRLR